MCKKIDEQAAYIKGKVITDVTQIDAKIETTPMDKDWVERIKDEHWYHKNDYTEEYIKRDPKNGHRMLELRKKLLSFGGQEVCTPMFEYDLENILDRGQLWFGDRIKMMKGQPSQCHRNSCNLWENNKDKTVLCTGYALSEDGLWRCHSWLVWLKPRKNYVVETTVKRKAYFGFVMTEEEANQFCEENF